MADDDDDIVFDRAGLLNNRVKPAREIHGTPSKITKHRCLRTILLCCVFLGIGMCIAIPGPTLQDLKNKVSVNIDDISLIFFARSLGYLAGSIFGGMLFDWLNQQLVIALALILTATSTIFIPFSYNLSLLNCFIGLQGLSLGVVDTGGNALLINSWGRKSGPYMQALHFAFGVGACIAPIIAAPFLASTNTTDLINSTLTPALTFTTTLPANLTTPPADVSNVHKRAVEDFEANMNQILVTYKEHEEGIKRSQPVMGSAFDEVNNMAVGRNIRNLREKSKEGNRRKPTITGGIAKHNKDNAGALMRHVDEQTEKNTETKSEGKSERSATNDKSITKKILTTTTATAISTTISTVTTSTASSAENTASASTFNKIKNAITDLNRFQFAYVTISVFMLFCSGLFWFSCGRDECTLLSLKNRDIVDMQQKESGSFKIQILALIFFFYFCYKGLEITFGQYMSTFVQTQLSWDEKKGAFVVAVFWGTFALTRALSIFFTKFIGPTSMLVIDLFISTIALLVLLIGLKTTSSNQEMVIWASTALFGIGLASILPTGFLWAERYVAITGKATSVFIVGSALGEMCIPLLTGYFMKLVPMAMVYILFACCLLCAIVFIILHNMASRQGEMPPASRRVVRQTYTDSETLELEPVRNGDTSRRKKVTFNIDNENAAKKSMRNRGGAKGD